MILKLENSDKTIILATSKQFNYKLGKNFVNMSRLDMYMAIILELTRL